MRRNNNSSLLLTVLGGAIFCFIFLGMSFIVANGNKIMKGNNETPIINNDAINLGDAGCTCPEGTVGPSGNYCYSNPYTPSWQPSTCDGLIDAGQAYMYSGSCYTNRTNATCTQAGITCLNPTYNGSSQKLADGVLCSITSNGYATNAGSYTVVCEDTGGVRVEKACSMSKASSHVETNVLSHSMQVGESFGLSGTASHGTISYSIDSGSGVISLSGSVVTALSAGNARVKVTASGDNNHNSSFVVVTINVTAPSPSCWCNATGSGCQWHSGMPSGSAAWVRYANLDSEGKCNNYSVAGGEACFRKTSDNKYYYGAYGASSGYTYVVSSGEANCLAKNDSNTSNEHVYALRCPSTILTFGSSVTCVFETDTDETIVNAVSTNGDIATAGGSTGSVVVTARNTEGTTTVRGVTSGGHQTTPVTIEVISNSNDAANCRISNVKVDQPIVSLNEQNNNPSNSYYIVHVSYIGSGCSNNTLTVTTNNGTVNPAGERNITTYTTTGQASFHIYPNKCKSSTPTATLSNGDKKVGATVNVTGDWKKTTGCYRPCDDSKCTNNDNVYDSFLEADLDNSKTGPYYSNWDANERCYKTKWTRNGCGGSTTSPRCYVDEQGGYHWTSNKEPSWRVVSGISNKDFCEAEEKEACYIDTTGKYTWGQYAKTEGYTLVTSIDNKTTCESQAGVCYKNSDNDYKWAETAPNACVQVNNCWIKKSQEDNPPSTCTYNTQEACEEVEGYKEVTGVTDPKDCGPEGEPACYVRESDGAWKWGNYSKITGYYLLEYEDGTAVPEDMCTNEVPDVPKTGISPTQLVYIFMAVLMACGVGFIYYSSAMKKTN